MPSLSNELRELAQKVEFLEVQLYDKESRDHESVYRYYYGKGALDFRDKLVEVLGGLKKDWTALEAYQTFLATFPDPYPGPAK